MQEKAKEILKRLLEYWNKWSAKQKTIIVSSVAGVILLIGVLVAVLSRTKYVDLYQFEDTRTASQAVSLLKDQNIATKLASDNRTVRVDQKMYSESVMIISTSDMATDEFGIDELLNTSLTTTNGERLLRSHLYLQNGLKKSILAINGVTGVIINYIPKDTSNRVLKSQEETPASLLIQTTNAFKDSSAETIAKMVAFALGNSDTELIKIANQKGEILYDGSIEKNPGELDATDKELTKTRIDNSIVEAVTSLLIINGYTEVEAKPSLSINFDKVEDLLTQYIPIEGENYGVLTEYHSTSSTGTGTSGDVPGTDSNDENDYYIAQQNGGTYSTETEDDFYQPSVLVKKTIYDVGVLSAENSSIGVTAKRVINRTEAEARTLGLLEDISWEEFKLRNEREVQTETPEELLSLISMATGISIENIELRTLEQYNFIEPEKAARDWSFYLQIILAVILAVFLLFVVIRGLSPVEVTELEPELSVEQLLATTKENQSLEDIEFSEQSETRKMIEKFFDENPEAVAQLLRNWLNEEWE